MLVYRNSCKLETHWKAATFVKLVLEALAYRLVWYNAAKFSLKVLVVNVVLHAMPNFSFVTPTG